MKFSIHLGIPEILALWTKLKKGNSEGGISAYAGKVER